MSLTHRYCAMLRVVLFLLFALSVEMANPSFPSPKPSPPSKTVEVRGTLVFIDLHEFGEQWAIRTKDRKLQPFTKGLQFPSKDRNGRNVEPGALVTVACVQDASGVCTSAKPDDITVQSAAAPLRGGVRESQRVLAMILDYARCGLAPGLNESDVRKIYLGAAQDGSGGIAEKYRQCSYGLFDVNATAFMALKVAPACSDTIISMCDYFTMASTALDSAQAALSATVFSSFTHYVYILPPGLQRPCGWSGLADTGGNQVWLQTSNLGIYRWASVLHESLHNYGLWHSRRTTNSEYNDFSSAMGRGTVCPNGAEISRLGWATPAMCGGELDATALPPGVPRTFILPATYLTGNGSYLRVLPNWLDLYPQQSSKNLYMAVRVAKAADANLSAEYAGKVNVHEVNAFLDITAKWSIDPQITLINATSSGSRAVLSGYNLVIDGSVWVKNDTMMVHLCRYIISDAECPDLSTLVYQPNPLPAHQLIVPPPRPLPPTPAPSSMPPNPPPPNPPPPNPPPPSPPPPSPPPPSPPPPERVPTRPRPPGPPRPPRPPPRPPAPLRPPRPPRVLRSPSNQSMSTISEPPPDEDFFIPPPPPPPPPPSQPRNPSVSSPRPSPPKPPSPKATSPKPPSPKPPSPKPPSPNPPSPRLPPPPKPSASPKPAPKAFHRSLRRE